MCLKIKALAINNSSIVMSSSVLICVFCSRSQGFSSSFEVSIIGTNGSLVFELS